MTLNKEKVAVEDMVLSMDTSIVQSRGVVTPFNAAFLPYTVSESVAEGLNNRYTSAFVLANFAKINGDSSLPFNVANAINDTEAVAKSQMDTEITILTEDKARKNEVLLKADPTGLNDGYHPVNDYSPSTKKYADGLIADKFLGAVTGRYIAKSVADGTTDVVVTVTNGVITEIS